MRFWNKTNKKLNKFFQFWPSDGLQATQYFSGIFSFSFSFHFFHVSKSNCVRLFVLIQELQKPVFIITQHYFLTTTATSVTTANKSYCFYRSNEFQNFVVVYPLTASLDHDIFICCCCVGQSVFYIHILFKDSSRSYLVLIQINSAIRLS